MEPRKLYEAGGSALVTFLTGLLVYQGFSDLKPDALYQPLIQALLVGLGALGFRVIPSKNGA